MRFCLIRALWCSDNTWKVFEEQLANQDHKCERIKVDYGGRGSILDKLSSVEAQVNAYKPEVIVGHSIGAWFAQKLFDVRPEIGKYCVLLAPLGPDGIPFWRLLNLVVRFPMKFTSGLLTGEVTIDSKKLANRFFFRGNQRLLDTFYEDLEPESFRAIYRAFPRWLQVLSPLPRIEHPIRAPCLVLAGEKDIIVSPIEAQRVAHFHTAEFEVIPDIAHMILEQSAVTAVLSWLETLKGKGTVHQH